ncbi:hypothetical protein D3C79_641800 [compost metagenome]
MHKSLVLQQLLLVQFAEQGTGTQANAACPGNGLGSQARLKLDADLACTKKAVQLRLQPGRKHIGRNVGRAGGNMVATQQGVGGFQKKMGGVQHAQLLPGVVKVRASVQRRRVPGKCRGTHGPQHTPGRGIAVRGSGEKLPGRMPLIAMLDKAVQRCDLGAVLARAEFDLG